MRHLLFRSLCTLWLALAATSAHAAQTARGSVFHDRNNNGLRDADEPGIPGMPVSNGADIVLSDKDGRWQLRVDKDSTLFVISGKGWVPPRDADQIPQFFYAHKPAGSGTMRYPGQAPTGPLPKQIDFPLLPSAVGDRFSIFVFGDPQPARDGQIDYLARDVISEAAQLKGPVLGISLGDIVSDDLSLYGAIKNAIGLIGLPWYNVPGNHDINDDVARDEDSNETFESVFGPATYAFQVGRVHFLILDDVIFYGQETAQKMREQRQPGQKPYVGGFREDQFRFIENYLKLVPPEDLVVLNMHIPLFQRRTSYYEGIETFRKADRERLFRLLQRHPHTLSMSAHTHFQQQHYFRRDEGWLQERPHHHFNVGTTCGDWFRGLPTYDGYPDATMRDGTPNGYVVIDFDGNQYRMRYKVAGADASKQMSLYLPYIVAPAALTSTALYANVYMGGEYTQVHYRIDGQDQWREMRRSYEPDPRTVNMHAYQKRLFEQLQDSDEHPYRIISDPQPTDHLWKATLPDSLTPGFHLAEVRVREPSGAEHLDRISFRVR